MLPIYGNDVLRRYVDRGNGKELPPHVYNVAHDAFYGVTSFDKLQSIVISGESGAGKTEATKRCLQYIAAAASSIGDIQNKILQVAVLRWWAGCAIARVCVRRLWFGVVAAIA